VSFSGFRPRSKELKSHNFLSTGSNDSSPSKSADGAVFCGSEVQFGAAVVAAFSSTFSHLGFVTLVH